MKMFHLFNYLQFYPQRIFIIETHFTLNLDVALDCKGVLALIFQGMAWHEGWYFGSVTEYKDTQLLNWYI